MPLHFSFTFGVGSYFNFSFGVGSPASKAAQTPKAKSSTELSIDPSKGRHIEPSSEPATTTTEHDHLIGKGLDTFVKFKDLQNIIGQDTLIPITRAAPKRVDGKKKPKLLAQSEPLLDELKSLFPPSFARPTPAKSTKDGRSVAECPLFTKLPLEIRHMIYGHLLVVPEAISRAHELVGGVQTVLAQNYHPIPGLNAAILRTCRSIYDEALPVLYGCNEFDFRSPDNIKTFQEDGLIVNGRFPTFNLKPAPHGRLTLLRKMRLSFQDHARFSSRSLRREPDRDGCWRDWSRTVFSEDKSSYAALKFPALRSLELDFSKWELTTTDELLVKPFIKVLQDSPTLSWLAIRDVPNHPTRRKFKDGFKRPGGVFKVIKS